MRLASNRVLVVLTVALVGCHGELPLANTDAGGAGDAGDGGDAGDAGDAGAADAGHADGGAPIGTLLAPIEIDASTLPAWFLDVRDSRDATSHSFDRYPPSTLAMAGAEFIYRFTLAQPAKISLTLASRGGAHVYAALLSEGGNPPALWGNDAGSLSDVKIDNTIGRTFVYDAGFLEPGTQLSPGTYYLSIDSPDDATAGLYELRLKLALLPSLCTATTLPTPGGTPIEVEPGDGCPAGMVRIPDTSPYCIDRYEAMLVGISDAGTSYPWSPYLNPGAHRVRALSVGSMIPQAYIDKTHALAACTAAGKRLCTYREWLRACRGSAGTTYPYGNTRDQNINPANPPAAWDPQGDACDDARWEHTAIEYFSYLGEGSSSYVFSHLDNPCIDQLPQSLDPTGWRPRCASEDGVMDMMGNIHEWIDERDVASASGGTRTVPAGHGAFAGGYYLDTYLNGAGCSYLTTAHVPSYSDESTGFRCCADLP